MISVFIHVRICVDSIFCFSMELWHVGRYCDDGGAIIWGEFCRGDVVVYMGWSGDCGYFLVGVSSSREYGPSRSSVRGGIKGRMGVN